MKWMKAPMKIWMSCDTSIYRFFVQIDKWLYGMYERGACVRRAANNEWNKKIWSCDPFESEARNTYTQLSSLFSKRRRAAKYCVPAKFTSRVIGISSISSFSTEEEAWSRSGNYPSTTSNWPWRKEGDWTTVFMRPLSQRALLDARLCKFMGLE